MLGFCKIEDCRCNYLQNMSTDEDMSGFLQKNLRQTSF